MLGTTGTHVKSMLNEVFCASGSIDVELDASGARAARGLLKVGDGRPVIKGCERQREGESNVLGPFELLRGDSWIAELRCSGGGELVRMALACKASIANPAVIALRAGGELVRTALACKAWVAVPALVVLRAELGMFVELGRALLLLERDASSLPRNSSRRPELE